jgi:hypothetical protein
MSEEYVTMDELRAMFRDEAKKHGSIAAFARHLEIYPSFAGNFLSGEKGPGFKILRHFGLEEVTLLRRRVEPTGRTLEPSPPISAEMDPQ